jgi:hypothetical protein
MTDYQITFRIRDGDPIRLLRHVLKRMWRDYRCRAIHAVEVTSDERCR